MQIKQRFAYLFSVAACAVLLVFACSAPLEAQAPYHRVRARPPHRASMKPRYRRR